MLTAGSGWNIDRSNLIGIIEQNNELMNSRRLIVYASCTYLLREQ